MIQEVEPFVSETCSEETGSLMMDLLEPTAPRKFGEGFKDFEFDTLLFPGVPMMPMADQEFEESIFSTSGMRSPASDFLESAPPSPLSSPTSSSSPLSESGIEDDSDMDDQVTTPAEYAMDDSTPAGVHTKTMCLPSVPCAITDSEAAAQARKLNEEHPSCLMEAQQELKKLLKQLISSPGAQPAKQPVVESTQTPLVVPAFNVSANRAGSPSTGITNAPVTVSSAEGQSMAQPQMGDDPVSALVSVLKPNMPQGEQPADVILQQNGNEHGARIEPKLVIIEEPEENYRARYESERCRGPIHGSKDNTYPTIQVVGYSGPVWITIHLVTSAGIPHYHSIRGPGSTKVPCKEVVLPGSVPAVQVMVASDTEMTAVLDSLSIRRLRNWEGDRELRKRRIDPRTWKKERKEARLMFQAEIPQENGASPLKLTCKSRIFQCSSYGAAGNPEILWASLSEGSVAGGDELGLIGKKFQSGFKVRFFADLPSGDMWEKFAEIDKSKSHQGAAVVSTPAYCDLEIGSPVSVNIEVVTGNSRDPKCSEPIEFTYQPLVKVQPVQNAVSCQGVILQQDCNINGLLGGQFTTVQGGVVTGTTVNRDFSAVGDLLVINQAAQLPETTADNPVLLAHQLQPDQRDWQALAEELKTFYQRGDLSTEHIKALCLYIERRDTLLLQAFRSARNAVSQEEFETKFKQYLSGMLSSLPL